MKGTPKNLDRYLAIFVALKKKNLLFVDMARSLEVTNTAVSRYASGIDNNKRFDRWVRDNLGLEL